LVQNWTNLEDLNSNQVCLHVAREQGATGVVLATLHEENGQLSLTMRLEGLGRPSHAKDEFDSGDESVRILLTPEIHSLLSQPGPDYSRSPDKIPEEQGVFAGGGPGVTLPRCTYCVSPQYSSAARSAKIQAEVTLSIVVTPEGKATSIYVLKGAPLGLTAASIESVRKWKFEPGQKDGKPVAVRVPIETTFRLY